MEKAKNDIILQNKNLVIDDILKYISQKPTLDEVFNFLTISLLSLYNDAKNVSIRITYNNMFYESENFVFSCFYKLKTLEIPHSPQINIELYYKYSPEELQINSQSEDTALQHIFIILTGFVTGMMFETLSHNVTERLKELKGINNTTHILNSAFTIDEALQEICNF